MKRMKKIKRNKIKAPTNKMRLQNIQLTIFYYIKVSFAIGLKQTRNEITKSEIILYIKGGESLSEQRRTPFIVTKELKVHSANISLLLSSVLIVLYNT